MYKAGGRFHSDNQNKSTVIADLIEAVRSRMPLSMFSRRQYLEIRLSIIPRYTALMMNLHTIKFV